MDGNLEDGSAKKDLVVNSTIELKTVSFYYLATTLLKSCPKGAGIFASWLASMITDEVEGIDQSTGLGIIIHLIDDFYLIEENTEPFEILMKEINSQRWIEKLTREQKSILIKNIIDHLQPGAVPIPKSAAEILNYEHKLSIPYILDSGLNNQQRIFLLMSIIEA